MTDFLVWILWCVGMGAMLLAFALIFRSILFHLDKEAPYKEVAVLGLIWGLSAAIGFHIDPEIEFEPVVFLYLFSMIAAAAMPPIALACLRVMWRSRNKCMPLNFNRGRTSGVDK